MVSESLNIYISKTFFATIKNLTGMGFIKACFKEEVERFRISLKYVFFQWFPNLNRSLVCCLFKIYALQSNVFTFNLFMAVSYIIHLWLSFYCISLSVYKLCVVYWPENQPTFHRKVGQSRFGRYPSLHAINVTTLILYIWYTIVLKSFFTIRFNLEIND